MTYETYRYIFIIAAILAGVMFVVSVILFLFLKIPTVIGDLTGSNARKAIENIRNNNEKTGEKSHGTSKVNRERGKLTDKISSSGHLVNTSVHSIQGEFSTEKIGLQTFQQTENANETTVLSAEGTANETTVLGRGNETTVLSQEMPANETTVLNAQTSECYFEIEYKIMYIHTDEMIN